MCTVYVLKQYTLLTLYSNTLKMFLIKSLLFGLLLAANGRPLDLINCTIPYDDLNISTVVIINATQYCHVDNCTVKILKTGNELNIAYHNDQYNLGCTTTTLQLLEVNDNFCEQSNNKVVMCILDSIVSIILIVLNTVVLIVVINQKKYSSLPFRLLLAATVVWIFAFSIILILSLTRFSLRVSNAFCILILILVSASFHCGKLLELEAFIAIFHTFYRCHKLYPPLSEKVKRKLFWMYLIVAFFVITIINASRGIIIVVLLSASYLNSNKFCISMPAMFTVTPITQYISVAVFIVLLKAKILFMILNGILFYVLSKNNNSPQARKSQICLIKIAVLLVCTSGVGLLVYYLAVAVSPNYSYLVAAIVMICKRCVLLYILLYTLTM